MFRFARIMEVFWLVLTILTAIWAGYAIATSGWAANKLLTWFPLICLAMFLYRRFTTKKMKAWLEREQQERERQNNP
jgi:hypothetical protein